jgi:hypothetical protein
MHWKILAEYDGYSLIRIAHECIVVSPSAVAERDAVNIHDCLPALNLALLAWINPLHQYDGVLEVVAHNFGTWVLV